MRSYYVMFILDGKDICGVWKRAKNEDQAILDAEFSLICNYPNVRYNGYYIANVKE